MKKNKYHWYRDWNGLTACGGDGKRVGGLIAHWFEMTETKDRCKICNRKYLERSRNDTGRKTKANAKHKAGNVSKSNGEEK